MNVPLIIKWLSNPNVVISPSLASALDKESLAWAAGNKDALVEHKEQLQRQMDEIDAHLTAIGVKPAPIEEVIP